MFNWRAVKAKVDKALVPPIRRFAEENPRWWKFIIVMAIIIPFGVMALIGFNFLLWPFYLLR